MKKALIIGASGQDGRLLKDLLVARGYAVLGIDRGDTSHFGPTTDAFQPVDIMQPEEVEATIARFQPDELYFFAAYHHSSEDQIGSDADLFRASYATHVTAYINVLEAVRKASPRTHIFYACSSHIFKGTPGKTQSEQTPINPLCVYGITKTAGYYTGRFYRNTHSLFVANGILYNHESSLRQDKFVSMKIIRGAVNIRNGRQDKLILGDLSAEIDWGYAPDYVDAFHRILNADRPDDFIVATGVKHQVRDFVSITFSALGLDWTKYIEERRSLIKKQNFTLVGNPAKLMAVTGWKPSVDFAGMIKLLLQAEGAVLHEI
jgi:GDPmannose 4,6-dehydratase